MHSNTSSSMKHVTYIAGISMLVLLNTSCGGKSEKSKELTYDIEALDNMPADSVDIRLVNTDIEFGNPSTIDFINDTLMIVFDTNVNDYVAHIIDTNGHHIRSFGRKGRGEGELISPEDLSLSQRKDSVFVYDMMLQRMLGFNISQLLSGEEQTPSQLQLNPEIEGLEYRFFHTEAGADGQLFGFGPSTARIVTMTDGNPSYTYTDYPAADEDDETNKSIWNYSGSLNALSPDRKKLVVATHIGGLFEIFDLDGGKLKSRTVKGFYKPEYSYAEGAVPKSVIPNSKNYIAGFRTLATGNDDFVAVLDGPDVKRINEIFTFDYDGEVKSRKIVGNGWVNIIGYNENGDIYCFAWDKDFKEMNLYSLPLKSL